MMWTQFWPIETADHVLWEGSICGRNT